MRDRRRLLTIVIVLCAFSVIGQEEPLPAIKLRQTPPSAAGDVTLPNFDLPVEPLSATPTVTIIAPEQSLASAAASNDYPSFAAAYAQARSRGEATAAYADLQALWNYQQENAVGAWYGADMHARLARTYPGYASYIADYAIVDSRGATFYPTAETRRFLLQEARNGSNSTRTALASADELRPTATRTNSAGATTSRATASRTTTADPAPRIAPRARRKRLLKAERNVSPASPAAVATAPQVASVVAPAPAPATVAPAAAAAPRTAPAFTAAATLTPGKPLQPQLAADQPTARGLVLLVLGIAGVGLLTFFMRTPAGATNQPAHSEPVVPDASANVEAISGRKATKEPRDARQATGSRG